MDVKKGQIVYFNHTEEYWNKPFVRKRHHTPQAKSVTLRGKVVQVQRDEFKATLIGNNNFEKDGETFVFHKLTLLCDQNFKRTELLGQWRF